MRLVQTKAFCPACWHHPDPDDLHVKGNRHYCPDCDGHVPSRYVP